MENKVSSVRPRRRSSGRSLFGFALVATGATSSAFGAVGWLSALRYPSLLGLVAAFVFYGMAPLGVGLFLLWQGLDQVEKEETRRHLEATSRAVLVDAVRGGATAAEVARKLALPNVRDVEQELDRLVLDDLALLDVTEEGDLVYRS